jgi:uncharacterized membrane protein YbaN (DUF454 family)
MRTVRQVTYTFIGVVFLIVGIAGLVLPFLQGWFFIAIGLIFISLESPELDNFLQKQARRNTTADKYFSKFRTWTREKMGYGN